MSNDRIQYNTLSNFFIVIYARGRQDEPYCGSDADGKLEGSDKSGVKKEFLEREKIYGED